MRNIIKNCFKAVLFGVCLNSYIHATELTVQVLDVENKPVSDIVIYITSENGVYDAIPAREVTVSQKDKRFVPYVSVKSTNDKLVFENKDNITHHIYTVTTNDFSFRLKQNTIAKDKQVSQNGKTLMACNIHDWMAGYLFVVETPYYGKTDSTGNFKISLPDNGKFTAKIWHPQMAELDLKQTMLLNLKEASHVKFSLTEKMAEIPTQENEEIFEFLDDY